MTDPRSKHVPVLWQQPLTSWGDWLTARALSRQSRATRLDHMRRLARALDGSPWDVTHARLIGWLAGQDWASETRRSVHASIRSFYDWAVDEGLIPVSPASRLPRVRASTPHARPAPDDALRQALAVADPRVVLIVRLAAEAGLRRGEIAQVHRRRDLTRDLLGWSLIVHGKGGKDRIVPLSDDLAALIRAGFGWLLPGGDHGHLSARWVGTLASEALPDGWTLHTLRHRFATRAYAATGDLLSVQRLLGHASPATTQRYIASSTDAMRRVMLAAA